jgi:oligopeptide/dipeptide ABC transporter ATP-binding protein
VEERPQAIRIQPVSAEMPSPLNVPPGCRFHTRCPRASERCRTEVPVLRALGEPGRQVACHHPLTDGGPNAVDAAHPTI